MHPLQLIRVADKAYLEAHDSQTDWEMPADFDYRNALEEVRGLGTELSRICGHTLTLDDQVQDASFFAEWVAYEDAPRSSIAAPSGAIHTFISIRFSSFGRMYSIWGCSDLSPITAACREQIIDHLHPRGFVFVPDGILDRPYHSPDFCSDWQTRFFSHL